MVIKLPLRIILLAAMGLGSLWMLHIIAQDYNKIRQPVAKLARLLISKRDVAAVLDNDNKIEDFEINWTKVLKLDPFKCALALICQVMAGAEEDNLEATNIRALIQYSIGKGAPEEIVNAYHIGLKNPKLFSKCYQKYPFCPYSAKVMLKLLEVHSAVFSSS
ncbi:hypothetical protein Bhyg_04473 [Pseudolycoriella hygida]|uniref:Uncharacterized protein n=1 Tax=Pseudolycoriella hygida TaxID=35572 RepID=A0A9Q0S8D9_9DIPT|nr:hypothetical protein Bhyg_04473 [Pseudolycoriella hygida]